MNDVTLREIDARLSKAESNIGFAMPLCNLQATGAPTVNDDKDDGYGAGSIWIHGATVYICVDPAVGAADWDTITTT